MGNPDEKLYAISIHAPRGGSDKAYGKGTVVGYISIHAPRGGSDSLEHASRQSLEHFNPRSPRGERHFYERCRPC